MWALYHKILDENFFFQKNPFLSRSRVIFEKNCDFCQKNAKNAIFESKMAKMTQMGWKLAKINFKVLSKKLTEQNFDFLHFFIFFFGQNYPKIDQKWHFRAFSGDFWQKNTKNLGDTEKNQNSDPKKSCKTNFV